MKIAELGFFDWRVVFVHVVRRLANVVESDFGF